MARPREPKVVGVDNGRKAPAPLSTALVGGCVGAFVGGYLVWTVALRWAVSLGSVEEIVRSDQALAGLLLPQPSNAIVRFLVAPFVSAVLVALYLRTPSPKAFFAVALAAGLAPASFVAASLLAAQSSHVRAVARAFEESLGPQVHRAAAVLGLTALPFWLAAAALLSHYARRAGSAPRAIRHTDSK